MQLPFVTSIEPSSASVANTPITIKFNIPVEDLETNPDNSLFTFKNNNIVITCNGQNINDLFETPYFNEDKTELEILPKSDKTKGVLLNNYIKDELNAGSVELKVTFSDAVKLKVNENEIELQNKKFSVYYLQGIDKVAPTGSLFITRDSSITLENALEFPADKKFNKQNIEIKGSFSDQEYSQLIRQNACNGTIYIYGSYYDNPSGIKTVIVKESYLRDSYGVQQLDGTTKTTEYTKNSSGVVFKTANGQTYFIIKHTLSTHYSNGLSINYHEGAIALDISVNDICYNSSVIEHYTVISKLTFNMHYLSVYAENTMDNYEWTDYDTYKASYLNHIKSLCNYTDSGYNGAEFLNYGRLDTINLYNHDFYSINPNNPELKLFLEYTNTSQTLIKKPITVETNDDGSKYTVNYYPSPDFPTEIQTKEYTYKLTCNINDFAIFPDTSIKLVIEDFLGNRIDSSIIEFPSQNDIYSPSILIGGEKLYLEFYKYNPDRGFYGKFGDSDYVLLREKNNKIECIKQYSKTVSGNNVYIDEEKKEITRDYSYSIMVNGINMPNSSFCISDDSLTKPEAVCVEEISLDKNVSNNHDGKLTVTIRVNDANEDGIPDKDYDYIFCENYYGITRMSKDSVLYITKMADYNFVDSYDSNRTYSFWGYKNGKKGTKTQIVFNKVEKTGATEEIKKKFDIKAPSYYYNLYGNEIEILLLDDWSGVESGTITVKNIPYELEKNGAGNYAKKIPFCDFRTYGNDNSIIEYFGKDKAGNIITETKLLNSFSFMLNQTIEKGETTGTYKLGNNIDSYCRLYFYEFGNNGFPTECSFTSACDYGNNFIISKTGIGTAFPSYEENSYLKVFCGKQYDNGTKECTNPLYYYYGEPGNKDNDFLLSNGNSDDSVIIDSDKPVYVHTVVTSAPIEECSTWDYSEWEYFKEEYNEKILNFSSTSEPKIYCIPVNKIKEGQNYIVIAHYSNNNVLMSPIMTK